VNDEDSDQMKVERRRHFEALASEEGNGASPIAAGGEIVTVHPLADEYDLLSRLGIRPEECVSVDSYWSIDGDVVFLQLIAASPDT
jgi:hypothetical protein